MGLLTETLTGVRTAHLVAYVEAVAARVKERRAYLTELDSAIGDADHGTNLDRGFTAVTAKLPTVVDLFPTADHQEREVYDFFGVVFEGHPDLRRILMPEDYEGHPQRRDFPMGGEPVLFTYNEHELPRWYD